MAASGETKTPSAAASAQLRRGLAEVDAELRRVEPTLQRDRRGDAHQPEVLRLAGERQVQRLVAQVDHALALRPARRRCRSAGAGPSARRRAPGTRPPRSAPASASGPWRGRGTGCVPTSMPSSSANSWRIWPCGIATATTPLAVAAAARTESPAPVSRALAHQRALERRLVGARLGNSSCTWACASVRFTEVSGVGAARVQPRPSRKARRPAAPARTGRWSTGRGRAGRAATAWRIGSGPASTLAAV